MDPALIGWLSIPALLLLFGLGMPVAYAMLVVGFVGYFIVAGPTRALANISVTPYSSVAVYTLSVIPLFVLMGNLAYRAGFGQDTFWAARQWVGRFRGGLAMATVLGCALFGAISGSSVANAVTFGKVAVPEMRAYGYSRRLAAAAVAAAGPLAAMIPPSILMVVYAMLTDQSVGKLLIAGYLPGFMTAGIFVVAIYLMTLRNPNLGPAVLGITWRDRISALKGVWSILLVALIVMAGIYTGIFTPTEAAGIGAAALLLAGVACRRLDLRGLWDALLDTAKVTGMIFAIVVGVFTFNFLIALTRLPNRAGEFINGMGLSPIMLLIAVMILYLILGCFMDTLAMVFLTMPVIFPIIVAQGINPIWFGILLVQNAEIGMITPPSASRCSRQRA